MVYISLLQGFVQSGQSTFKVLSSQILFSPSKKLKYFSEICLHLFVNTESTIKSQGLVSCHELICLPIHLLNKPNNFLFLKMESLSSEEELYFIDVVLLSSWKIFLQFKFELFVFFRAKEIPESLQLFFHCFYI